MQLTAVMDKLIVAAEDPDKLKNGWNAQTEEVQEFISTLLHPHLSVATALSSVQLPSLKDNEAKVMLSLIKVFAHYKKLVSLFMRLCTKEVARTGKRISVVYYILFYFILYYFILFYFVLFYFILFYFIFVLFYFVLFLFLFFLYFSFSGNKLTPLFLK